MFPSLRTECWPVCVLLLIVLLLPLTDGCGGIGDSNQAAHTTTSGNQTGHTFFVQSAKSTCCGHLTTWRFYASATGTVTAMLWRPTTGTNYKLVLEDTYAVSSIGLTTKGVNHEAEIGDVIGWRTGGAELIPYGPDTGSMTQNQLIGSASIGTEISWAQTPDSANTYAFGAVITENEAPTVTDATVSITSSQTSQAIHTLAIADTDTVPITNLTSVTETSGNADFSVVKTATGWEIQSGATLTAGTHTLQIEATDRCGVVGTGTITVTVTNTAPVFVPNPLQTTHTTAISDQTTAATSLYTFSVQDTDPITCNTSDSKFEVRTVAPNFQLWLKAASDTAIDYNDGASLVTTITCTDGSTSITSTYTVPLSDEIPVLSGLGGTSGPLGDLTTPIGTSVMQFTVVDQDDVVECSVSAPENTNFEITALTTTPGTQTYDLKTKALLNEDSATSHTVGISCTDKQNTAVTGTQTVTVSDDKPTLMGLPATSTTIDDGVQTAAQLSAVFSVTDANDQSGITCTIDAPNDALFEIKTGTAPEFQVWTKTGQTLTPQSYSLAINCKDDETANVVSGTYTAVVGNKAPTFVGTFPSDSPNLSDDTVASTSLAKFTVSERDVACSVTNPTGTVYEIRNVTTAAAVTEAEIWVGASVTQASINFNAQPVPLVLTVTCTDGTTAITGTFNVNIVDANPTLTGLPGTPYSSVSDSTTTAAQLDVFNVTDSDDTITCAVDPALPDTESAAKFEVRAGTPPEFQIWVKDNPGLNAGTKAQYTVPITCTDGTTAAIVTGNKIVNVISAPPLFVNLPATSTTALTDATNADTQIHSFSVTDSATDTISCSYTAPAPNNNDFEFRGTQPDFQLWVKASNSLNFNTASPVQINITCTDGTTPISAGFNLTLSDEDPTWTNLPAAGPYQSLSDTTTTATSLYKFSVSDSDDTISCSVTGTEATRFEVRALAAPEFEIYYKGSPATVNFESSPNHTLTVTCTDGASYTKSENYVVEIENAPPTFVGLPDSSVTIQESEITNKFLYTFSVSDTTETVCTLTDTVIAAGILPLEKGTVALPHTEYKIYAHNKFGFDFEAGSGSINVVVTCGDTTSTATSTFVLNIQNSAPVITNPGGSSTITESEAGVVDLKTISLAKFDENAVCTLTDADGGPFAMTGNKLQKIAGPLDYETKMAYNLQISCTDGLLTTTDTYTVNVANTGPEITNLPLAGEIDEGQVPETSMIGITTSEDVKTCYQVDPQESEFVVKFEPTTSLWTIYYVSQAVAGKTLNYSSKSYYEIKVQCNDTSDKSGNVKTYGISVKDNAAPVSSIGSNPPAKEVIIAKEIGAGDTVYTVTGTDAEGDDITFSLDSCEPSATCPFTMTSDGIISSTANLHSHNVSNYVLKVKATDKYNLNPEPKELIFELSGINTVTNITNLPKADCVGITENNAAGAVVLDVNHEDPDTIPVADTITYSCNFIGTAGVYFECDTATGEVKAKSALNYEQMTITKFSVNITANDGYADSETKVLTICVNHENEQPEFSPGTMTITKPDEGGPNEEIACPDLKGDITDEDRNDYYRYTMVCPTGDGVFVMDQKTGCVKMTKEWDLDATNKRSGSETIPCTVTATDSGGLTTTKTLNIVIEEEDDNKPYLEQTTYMYCAGTGSSSGTLGSVTANDNDVLAQHKRLTYELVGGNGGPLAVDGNGQITHGDISSYNKDDTHFETTLRVTDDAGHYTEAKVSVFICDPVVNPPSSSSSSSSSSSGSSTSAMLAWLIPLILGLALAIPLIAYCARRCYMAGRCGSCCNRGGGRSLVQRQLIRPVKHIKPTRIAVTPPERVVRKPLTPVKPTPTPEPVKRAPPPGDLGKLELPIMHYYARDTGNLGNPYPTV